MRDFFNFDGFFNLFDSEFGKSTKPFSSIDNLLGGKYEKTIKEIEIPGGTCIMISYTLKPKQGEGISNLKSELEKAIEEQEFEKAAELRDKIKEMEITQGKITKLKEELDLAIKNQEFEKAAEIRDQIKSLKK